MNSKDILFSIIVPVYNVEPYLKRCLDSIVNQTYPNIEIILVNDGSTDNSAKICEEYLELDSRIILKHQANAGLSEARNTGLKIASGDYIIFVDSDDSIVLNACEVFFDYLVKNPSTEVLCSNCVKLNKKRVRNKKFTIPKNKQPINGYDFLKLQLKQKTFLVEVVRSVYKKSFLLENDLFFKKGIIHEDEHWTTIMFLKASSILVTGFVHYNYILRPGSIMTSSKGIESKLGLIDIQIELENIFKSITDKELKSLLILRSMNIFFRAFHLGKIPWKPNNQIFANLFFKSKDYSLITKIKAVIFNLDHIFHIVIRVIYPKT